MSTRFAGCLLAGVVFAFVFGPDGPLGGLWRPQEGGAEASGAVLVGFVGVTVAEGLGLGAALGVLLLKRPWFTRVIASPALATAGWLSAAWLLGSWGAHSAMHRHLGDDSMGALLAIEWIFHVGSIAAIAVLLVALFRDETTGAGGSRRAAEPSYGGKA